VNGIDIAGRGARSIALVEAQEGLHIGQTRGNGLLQPDFEGWRCSRGINATKRRKQQKKPVRLHQARLVLQRPTQYAPV
jgi:hypothetical protein